MRVLLLQVSLVFTLLFGVSLSGFAAQTRFSGELSGNNEVPAVKTEGIGDIKITVFEKSLSFELSVANLTSPTGAHIHKGKKGENGPPIAGLFGGPVKEGRFNGILAEGTITEDNLLGELEGKSVADLVRNRQPEPILPASPDIGRLTSSTMRRLHDVNTHPTMVS